MPYQFYDVQAISTSLVYRAKIARLVTQGTFAFAICGLRTRRPALRLLRHIGRLRDRNERRSAFIRLYCSTTLCLLSALPTVWLFS